MPYAQATVRKYEDGTIVLQSYSTAVAYIEPDGRLYIRGLYSATTRRHIGAFVKEYANLDYQTAKRIYEDGYGYNIHTGEIVEVY
jgi:hypothetical protein